jgi:hypothetical protein
VVELAGDLLYPSESLEGELPNLDPLLAALQDGGKLARKTVAPVYARTLCALFPDGNRPASEVCAAASAGADR